MAACSDRPSGEQVSGEPGDVPSEPGMDAFVGSFRARQ